MAEIGERAFSSTLHNLTSALQLADRDLKSNPSLDGADLLEFRQALDNVRLTAWTVNELRNARQTEKDPRTVASFVAGDRLRRVGQMVRELSVDLEQNGASWPAQSLSDLEASLALLYERLGIVIVGEGG